MSLTERTALPVAEARPPGKPGGKAARWVGLAFVVAGLILMWPAVADAVLADPVVGSAAGETLRGTPRGEELATFGGADELYGGPGRDVLRAGAGDDFVESGDGERDLVFCGKGDDTASADEADFVSRDCETVYVN